MAMRSLVLILACLTCTCRASSSKALAQFLTSAQKGSGSPAKGSPSSLPSQIKGQVRSVADKAVHFDETAAAEALFSSAALVLAASDLHAGIEKVGKMDKELTVEAVLVVASFLKTLQATSKVLIPALPDKIVPNVHESEVAEVLFVTGGLTLAIYELVTNWQKLVEMKKEIKTNTAVTVAKFLKVLESTFKTTKSSLATYKSVR